LKKLVTILLVMAMVLGMSSIAFGATFSDTADLSKASQSSIAKLNALKIVEGYPDGTFKPANNITRAEFAKIATVIAGMQNSAAALQNTPSQYSDTVAGSWYMGWVNLSSSQGYMKGYPDGSFKPNATITNAEVVTVLLRILGYNDNLPGPWPVDYIAKAASLDITEDVAFDAAAPAKRVDVAVMVDATLDTKTVDWDVEKEKFVDNDTKLMEESFDAAVNSDYIMNGTEMDDDVWSIDVDATDNDDDDLDGDTLDLAADVAISDGGLVTWLDWAIADILYNADDEEVVYIEITSTSMVVDGEDMDYNADDEEIEILDKTYDFADYFSVGKVLGTTNNISLNNLSDDKAYRVLVNEDGDVYRITERTVDAPAIVDEYKTTTEKLTFKDKGTYQTASSIDFTDEDVLVEKAGAFIQLADLKANDVLYIDENSYGYDYYIDVRTMTATGVLQSARFDSVDDATEVRIGGTWYDVADANTLSRNDGEDFDENIDEAGLEDIYDEEVTFFLNKAMQVCIISSDVDGSGNESANIYGVVTRILSYDNIEDLATRIKVLKTDGTEATYTINTDDVELAFDGYAQPGNEIDRDYFIKFQVNDDNEIDTMTVLANVDDGDVVLPMTHEDYIDDDNDKYVGTISNGDTDNNRIKFDDVWYTLNDDTVVFNAFPPVDEDDDDQAVIEDNEDVVDWAENMEGTSEAYVQFSGNKITYMFLNAEVSAAAADYAVVLDKYYSGEYKVAVDIMGTEYVYEDANRSETEIGSLYDYSVSSEKFYVQDEIFNPEDFAMDVAEDVYYDDYREADYLVTDTADDAIEIDDVWYYADEDTIVYDYSDYYADGDDPVFVDDGVAGISEDDLVIYIDGDDDGIAELFIIVNDVVGYETFTPAS